MESLIIFAIIAIISSLFTKEKKPEKQQKPSKQQMPPFGQPTIPKKSKPVPVKPKPVAKSLEDFANEIFGQLNEKAEQEKPKLEQSASVAPVVVERAERTFEVRGQGSAERKSNRPPLTERPITAKLKEQEKPKFVPQTKAELVHGLVMAEILGPPKAKRK